MYDNSNIIIPFLSEHFFYWIGFLLPALAVFIGWVFYFVLGHNEQNGYLPTISGSFVKFPESRIFAVCMGIESCILAAVFYIRYMLIFKMCKRYSQKTLNKNSQNSHKTSIKDLNRICCVLAYAVCICLVGLSAITLEDSKIIHLAFATIFWGSFVSYFIISDIAAKRVRFPIRFISLILPYCILFFITVNVFVIIRCSPEEAKKANNTMAFMQNIVAFLLFLKVMLIGYDNPPHDLVSSNSKIEVKLV